MLLQMRCVCVCAWPEALLVAAPLLWAKATRELRTGGKLALVFPPSSPIIILPQLRRMELTLRTKYEAKKVKRTGNTWLLKESIPDRAGKDLFSLFVSFLLIFWISPLINIKYGVNMNVDWDMIERNWKWVKFQDWSIGADFLYRPEINDVGERKRGKFIAQDIDDNEPPTRSFGRLVERGVESRSELCRVSNFHLRTTVAPKQKCSASFRNNDSKFRSVSVAHKNIVSSYWTLNLSSVFFLHCFNVGDCQEKVFSRSTTLICSVGMSCIWAEKRLRMFMPCECSQGCKKERGKIRSIAHWQRQINTADPA